MHDRSFILELPPGSCVLSGVVSHKQKHFYFFYLLPSLEHKGHFKCAPGDKSPEELNPLKNLCFKICFVKYFTIYGVFFPPKSLFKSMKLDIHITKDRCLCPHNTSVLHWVESLSSEKQKTKNKCIQLLKKFVLDIKLIDFLSWTLRNFITS